MAPPPLPPFPPLSTSSSPSLLFLILDIHPLSWHLLCQPPPPSNGDAPPHLGKVDSTPLNLSEFLDILMVFLNAHLAARWGNEVVLYAATAGKSKLLYPPPTSSRGEDKLVPNTYYPFRLLDKRFEHGLKGMIQEEQARFDSEPASMNASSRVCIDKDIMLILPTNTTATETETNSGPDRIEPRIMIINATPSSSPISNGENGSAIADTGGGGGGGEMRGGYVGLMNCVFAAQKAKVPIDVLTLPSPEGGSGPPIFLQQAAHLTEGVYWRWNGRGGLLQYLHSIFLAPPSLRHKPFAVPPQDAVDFRAVCFCHHNVVDVGFVCSVCLSIFCEPKSSCMMCKTKFPIKAIPTLRALASNISPIPIPVTIPPAKGTTNASAMVVE